MEVVRLLELFDQAKRPKETHKKLRTKTKKSNTQRTHQEKEAHHRLGSHAGVSVFKTMMPTNPCFRALYTAPRLRALCKHSRKGLVIMEQSGFR